jgi:hypothetical protein
MRAASRWLVYPVADRSFRPSDVRDDALVLFVVGDGAAAEGFGVGQVDLRPDRGGRVLESVACPDEVGLGERGGRQGSARDAWFWHRWHPSGKRRRPGIAGRAR